MRYDVRLKQSEEGFSVWVPELPGCWSQGATEAEALQNIREAIGDYVASMEEEEKTAHVLARTVEVA